MYIRENSLTTSPNPLIGALIKTESNPVLCMLSIRSHSATPTRRDAVGVTEKSILIGIAWNWRSLVTNSAGK